MWLILLLCIIAAFANIIGGALTVFKRLNQNEIQIATGLGTGFLLGATILDRLPASMNELPTSAPLYIMIGYLALLIIERYSSHNHVILNGEDDVKHTSSIKNHMHSKAALILFIGMLFHTFMDGVIIAGSFSIDRSTGILIFLAIAMHKIPVGFSMATIYLTAGKSRRRALFTSIGLAISTMIGAIVSLTITEINIEFIKIFMAFATGTFLFISTTDMVPAIRNQRSSAILSIFIGVTVFYISLLFIEYVGLG